MSDKFILGREKTQQEAALPAGDPDAEALKKAGAVKPEPVADDEDDQPQEMSYQDQESGGDPEPEGADKTDEDSGDAESDAITNDIERALAVGTGREGRLYRLKKEKPGLTRQEYANELDCSTASIWATNATLDYMMGGDTPENLSRVTNVRGRLRAFFKRHRKNLGPETINYFNDLLDECTSIINSIDPAKQNRMKQTTSDAESEGKPGVYVYTLPHYINYPVQPSDDEDTEDRTWLKIGMSNVDVVNRVRRQPTTMLPEPPVLLRIYSCGRRDIATVEKTIHKLLDAFDHNPNRLAGAGREWFMTSLPALDELADALNLKTEFAYED